MLGDIYQRRVTRLPGTYKPLARTRCYTGVFVQAVNGLVENLRSERKRVPEEVLLEAERLECLLFSGYDPHFDGDEPPGL